MLRATSELIGMPLRGLDGEIGLCEGLLFDDRHWTVRYLVARTGDWMPDRQVLISAMSVESLNDRWRQLSVIATRRQIEQWRDRHADVAESAWVETRDHASELSSRLPPVPVPGGHEPHRTGRLRSVERVLGFAVEAIDGPIGRVEDLLVDLKTWTLPELVVGTDSGRPIMIAPDDWITSFDWERSTVHVDLPRLRLEASAGDQATGRTALYSSSA